MRNSNITTESCCGFRISRFSATVLITILLAFVQVCAIPLFPITTVYAAMSEVKASRVLYLNSYNRGYKWSDDIERGLLEQLQSTSRKVELSVEFLDSRRFPNTERYNSLAAALAGKYTNYRHDLVVVSDNFAFEFATKYRNQLFPDLPIVFCGYNDFRPDVIKDINNITGVNEEIDITKTVELATRVQPAMRTIAFIISTADASNKRMTEVAERAVFPSLSKKYNLIVIKDASMAEIRTKLGTLPKNSAVFLVGQTSDQEEGRALTPMENGRMISAVSPVPVYSFWDFHIGTGVLGGHIITGLDQGHTAGDMALRILNGTRAENIPVIMQTPASDIFDFKVMKHYGIPLSALPEACTVVNRPDSDWEKYKLYILGVMGFFLLLSVTVLTLTLNILKRRRVEQKLAESQTLLKSIFDSTDDMIWVVDPVSFGLCSYNRSVEEYFLKQRGICLELGARPEDLFPAGQFVQIWHGLFKRALAEESFTTEYAVYSGARILELSFNLLKRDGIVFGISIFGKDITERKKADEELKNNEQRTASLLRISNRPFTTEQEFLDHALNEVIALTASTIGYIYFYDEDKRQFTLNSWSKEVMAHCTVMEQQSIYDLDKTGLWGEAVRQRKPILCNEYAAHNPHKQGLPDGHVPLRRFLTVPLSIDGSIVAVVGVANKKNEYNDADVTQLALFMDAVWKITERKRAAEEKIAIELKYQQTQKLESLGVLAGGIAHDFNNILTVIMAQCSFVMRNHESFLNRIPVIESAALRAAELCRQMLVYAGKAQTVLSQVDITALVDEMVTMLRSTVGKKAVIKFVRPVELPYIMGDASQIRQIVMNLIINASEAIGETHGEICISVTNAVICLEQQEKDFNGKAIAPGEYICLEVTDNGCGMTDETIKRIFEPFYTTKFTGRGLGMSAVLGIITAHAGGLQLTSQAGLGTTFKVYLPVVGVRPPENESLQQATLCLEEWRGSGTILLVDDEEMIRDIAADMLKYLGFTIIEAGNGKEAIELYKRNAGVITLIVTDIGMPVMDGYELFIELKKLNPLLPIIITSGFGDTSVTSKIPREQIAGLVSKPYNLDQLYVVLKKVVEDAHHTHT